MKQVLIIHGGSSFSTYEEYLDYLRTSPIDYSSLKIQNKWKSWVAKQMPEADVLLPTFPSANNAIYDEWKIYFEKLIPFLQDDLRLVGHSLGAMFLAKYLDKHALPCKIHQLILIAGYHSTDIDVVGSFDIDSVKNLQKCAKEVHLFHSTDDLIVPFGELTKFQNDLPNATSHIFNNRGHFNEKSFPELLELLQR